jgi:hypothetical protein
MFLGFVFLSVAIFSACDNPETIINSHNPFAFSYRCLVVVDCVFEEISFLVLRRFLVVRVIWIPWIA